MHLDATIADWVALAIFTFCVIGYSRYSDNSQNPRMLNAKMRKVRRLWIRHMLAREDRVTDTLLTGHSANAISFFASATILVLVGLIGIVSRTRDLHALASEIILVHPTSLALFQFKLLGLISIFIFGFYRFTWSLLQASYYFGLMGAALPVSTLSPTDLDHIADAIAIVLNNVFTNFHSGIRTYYYGLAWLGWIFQPMIFSAATLFITLVLIWRQLRSPAALAIQHFADVMEKESRR